MTTTTRDELEAAILANPTSVDAYLVFGDWLSEQGDPLGELISIQTALAKMPPDAALLRFRSDQLIEQHSKAWLGEYVTEMKETGPGSEQVTCAWRYGFLDSIAMGGRKYGYSDPAKAFESLIQAPASRFLRHLEFNIFKVGENPYYGDAIALMGKLGLPRTLKRLVFDVRDYQLSWAELGSLAPAMPHLQRLESLRLKIGQITLGKRIYMPALRSLEIITGGFGAEDMRAINEASWPCLESLTIYLGDDDYGATCTIDDVMPILNGGIAPGLKQLSLCNAEFQDDIAQAIATSKILPQLETIDLSQGTMGDVGAQALLANANALKHLRFISLSENWISPEMVEQLSETFGADRIGLDGQQDDEGDVTQRYVQVSE